MMRIVVTGAAGFLGSHLVDRLLARGDEVVGLDNECTGSWQNLAHHAGHPNLTMRTLDVSQSWDVEGPVDWVFHFASPASPKDFERMPLAVMRANSFGSHQCLELCQRKGARFFLASTSEVYGDPLVSPQGETYLGNVNPIGIRAVYDESKRYAEALTMAYRRFMGIDVRIVRFFNTYGPRMREDDGRIVPNFIRQALAGEPLTVYGDGLHTRSFSFVDDSLTGVLMLADSGFQEPVNIGTEFEFTVLEFAHLVIRLTGSSSKLKYMDPLPDDPKHRRPDLSRALKLLGYRPSTTLEEGLQATIDYFKNKPVA